jgi:DNA-binding NarL/FixJ family response regulator
MAIRVLIVDDHQVVIDGLRSVLGAEADVQIVGAATVAKDAVELARQHQPDVVVLDVTMPGTNGFEVLRQIRAVAPDAEVVALSMHSSGQIAADMLRAGASSYVLKAASVQHLLAAIRTVVTGETYLPPEVASMVPQELLRPHERADGNPGDPLSAREKEVLSLVAQGKSSKEAAADLFVTTKTIVWHRQSIMGKLGLRTVPELTKYAIRMGLTSLDA